MIDTNKRQHKWLLPKTWSDDLLSDYGGLGKGFTVAFDTEHTLIYPCREHTHVGYLLRRVVSLQAVGANTSHNVCMLWSPFVHCQCRLVVRTQASHAWDRGFDPLHWYFATFRSIGPHYAIMPSRTQNHVHLRDRSTDALQINRRRSRQDNWNMINCSYLRCQISCYMFCHYDAWLFLNTCTSIKTSGTHRFILIHWSTASTLRITRPLLLGILRKFSCLSTLCVHKYI